MTSIDSFVAEGFTYLGIAVLLILLRIGIRIHQIRRLFLDDWFMLLALVPYITETILAYMVGATYNGLSNTNMTDEERQALDPASEEYRMRVGGSKVQVGGWIMYTAVLWAVKASLCAFYSRLTAGLKGYTMRIRVGYILLAVSYLAVICIILFTCQPMPRLWQISPAPGNFCEPGLSKLYLLVPMTLNVLTDIYLVIIPITILKGAHLPSWKKLGLFLIFSGAIFCITAALLRGILVLRDPVHGIRQGSLWACRESFVACVTANVPALWGWLKIKLQPLFGSLMSEEDEKALEPAADALRLAEAGNGERWEEQNAGFRTVIHGGRPKEDGSDASVKDLSQLEKGITKDVTVVVKSEQVYGMGLTPQEQI